MFCLFNDEDFFDILERAPDCFWKIFAERTRIKLEDQLRENQQVNFTTEMNPSNIILLSSFINYSMN